jgi:hypothetical protein
MPKLKIRSIIRAKPNHLLLAFDLSQAESWVVAYLANEPRMKKALMYGDINTSGLRLAITNCVLSVPC